MTITWKTLGFWILVVGFIVAVTPLLHGCAGLMGPSATQIDACSKILDAQFKTGIISKTQGETYDAQMRSVPASLPAPCIGKV